MPPVPKSLHKSKAKSQKQACIDLSSRIVTHRGMCLRCGKSEPAHTIDPHHIVPGRSDSIVARVDAQIPMCQFICHRWAHDFPEAFKEWIDSIFPGRRQMLEAVVRSQVGIKKDWDAVLANLKERAAILEVE